MFITKKITFRMDTVWFMGNGKDAGRQQAWFKHIGIGQNIRTKDKKGRPIFRSDGIRSVCREYR